MVTVTASAGEDGAISPSGETQYYYESDAAYTITPNEGYVISDVLVDGQSVGAVSSYTFSKLTTGHTIRAEFESITFTVTFADGITGETLDTQTAAYGKDAAAPPRLPSTRAAPSPAGTLPSPTSAATSPLPLSMTRTASPPLRTSLSPASPISRTTASRTTSPPPATASLPVGWP